MVKYKIVHTNGYPISQEQLDRLGAEGWQLIQVIADVAYFSKVEPPQKRGK